MTSSVHTIWRRGVCGTHTMLVLSFKSSDCVLCTVYTHLYTG